VPLTYPELTVPTIGFRAVTAGERVCEGQEDQMARRLDRQPGLRRFCIFVELQWVIPFPNLSFSLGKENSHRWRSSEVL
jgi:hypothetical protein